MMDTEAHLREALLFALYGGIDDAILYGGNVIEAKGEWVDDEDEPEPPPPRRLPPPEEP